MADLIVAVDGGGVRGYGSLLMLQVLMMEIRSIEQSERQPGGKHESSFAPYEEPTPTTSHSIHQAMNGASVETTQRARSDRQNSAVASPVRDRSPADSRLRPSLSDYLPSHYFDYIGGTSTGG
jgi:hypothetical protein